MSVPYAGGYLGLGNSFTSQNRAVSVGGWVELGRTTLGSGNSDIAVTSLSDKRYYKILTSTIGESVSVDMSMRLNGISTSTYANRWSLNGGSDGTTVSQDKMNLMPRATASATPKFSVSYLANLSTNEKLLVGHGIHQLTAGAATASDRTEVALKHAQTTNPVSTITVTTATAATYDTGSEVVVLGWDPADTHTDNFWEELVSVDLSGGAAAQISSGTFTAKKYLWVQFYIEPTAAGDIQMTFNNDTGTNYARRGSNDGGTDFTSTSGSSLVFQTTSTSTPSFTNMFIINNSAEEKLGISHTVNQNTALSTTAPERKEQVHKWDNTAAQITEIDLDTSTSTYATKTILKVWGSD